MTEREHQIKLFWQRVQRAQLRGYDIPDEEWVDNIYSLSTEEIKALRYNELKKTLIKQPEVSEVLLHQVESIIDTAKYEPNKTMMRNLLIMAINTIGRKAVARNIQMANDGGKDVLNEVEDVLKYNNNSDLFYDHYSAMQQILLSRPLTASESQALTEEYESYSDEDEIFSSSADDFESFDVE